MNSLHLSDTCRFLKSSLYRGDYEEFDRAIGKYKNERPEDDDLKELAAEMINHFHYIFSFQSFSIDCAYNRNERFLREMKILEVFPYDSQMDIIMLEIDDVCEEHVGALKKPARDAPKIQDVHFIASLLFKKKFKELDLFLSKTPWDLLHPSNRGYFFYRTKNSRGASSVKFDSPLPLFTSSLFFLDNDIFDYLKTKGVGFSDFFNAKNHLLGGNIERILTNYKEKDVNMTESLHQSFSLIEKNYLLETLRNERKSKPKKLSSKI